MRQESTLGESSVAEHEHWMREHHKGCRDDDKKEKSLHANISVADTLNEVVTNSLVLTTTGHKSDISLIGEQHNV